MINIETLADNALDVHILGRLETGDFAKIAGHMNGLIQTHGTIKLLIDATEFDGWANAEAAKEHFAFVRDHHEKIERIALVAGHEWQHWVAAMAGVFIHPEIKVFGKDGLAQAESWITKKLAA